MVRPSRRRRPPRRAHIAAEGALAYGPVVAWLRSERISRYALGRLDRAHLTELARLLPELLTAGARSPSPGAAARERPAAAALRRRRAGDPVRRGCPLLLVADDSTGATARPCSSSTICSASSRTARLLVAATARREESDQRHPLNDLVAGLQRFGTLHRNPARPALPRRDGGARRADHRTGPVEEPNVDRLYGETEGNPLFVVEALRAGWTRRPGRRQVAEPEGAGGDRGPPRAVVGTGPRSGRARRDDRPGVHARRAGRRKRGRRRRTSCVAWTSCGAAAFVREQGADAYDFSHDKIREVAYLGLSPARRRRSHLRVAQALERRHTHDPGR